MNPSVRTAVDDGVLTITLDRPKANAIDVTTSLALHAAFVRLQQEPALRVAILTGTGRFFRQAGICPPLWRARRSTRTMARVVLLA